MRNNFLAFVVGLVFAVGLGVSGMTQPSRIVGFLDVFGDWDPSLVFVMLGAIVVHFFAYKIIRKRKSPLFSDQWHVPNRKDITPALIVGALIFGIGWGIGGYCPGPAMVSIASVQTRPLLFILSMFIGMFAFRVLEKRISFKK